MKPISITPPPNRRRSPDLTPVMDVVFILVVFFMVVSTFSHSLVKPLKVSVPGAVAQALESADRRVLLLDTQGALLDGVPVSDLATALGADAAKPLSIVAGEGASYQALVDALDAAQLADVVDVRVEVGERAQ